MFYAWLMTHLQITIEKLIYTKGNEFGSKGLASLILRNAYLPI